MNFYLPDIKIWIICFISFLELSNLYFLKVDTVAKKKNTNNSLWHTDV